MRRAGTKEARVILALARLGPMHPPLLARVAVGENSVSAQLQALRHRGLIERRNTGNPAPVSLTPEGRAAARMLRQQERDELIAAIEEAQR